MQDVAVSRQGDMGCSCKDQRVRDMDVTGIRDVGRNGQRDGGRGRKEEGTDVNTSRMQGTGCGYEPVVVGLGMRAGAG